MIEQVSQIAIEAGQILLNKKNQSLSIFSKDSQGIVTEADRESESFIKKKLFELEPNAFFLGEEESYSKKNKFIEAKQAKLCWHVDPLDGTNNFVSGLDYYAVSIALSLNKEVILGVIYIPEMQKLFYASKDSGSFLKSNGKVITLKAQEKIPRISEGVFGTCLNSLNLYPEKLETFKSINSKARSIRRFGAACIDLCLVAEGRLSGFWEFGLNSWDICAGAIICKEAGLKVNNFQGGSFMAFDCSILCTSSLLVDELTQAVGDKLSKLTVKAPDHYN
jgi:myo-inositol-1(or 4)-monophosphatase